MSLYDNVFGPGQNAAAAQSQYNQNAAAQLGLPEHSMNTQRDQKYVQQAFSAALNQYNQNPFAYTRDWVFAGKPCTIQEFADLIWPGDSEDKMLFILTHSGPKTGPKQK